MQFTSLFFALFFAVVFFVYWIVFKNSTRFQNISLLIFSYIFYGSWDYRFLLILIGYSFFNYFMGIFVDSCTERRNRRLTLIAGLTGNIAVLVLYKYYNFFLEGIVNLLKIFSISLSGSLLKLIVPVGLSFYTFISVSYLVDIYRRKLTAERNFIDLFLSLGYFPIILAGPIQRPVALLPQLKKPKVFDSELASDGLRQFLWGLAVKMIIANNLGLFINKVFSGNFEGSTNFYAAILFTIQIYADFASYSDMAIGISKILGIRLIRNFQFPYFAKDIGDFWKRWHISLTSWFRDYIFLPLAYYLSRKIKQAKIVFIQTDTLIYLVGLLFTWLLTGLWHGAKTTFLIWGLLHAILLSIHHLMRKPKKAFLGRFNMHHDMLYAGIQRIYTLLFVVIGWTFFRAESTDAAFGFIDRTLKISLFSPPVNFPTIMIIPLLFYFIIEWQQRDREHGLDFTGAPKTRFIRWSVYLGIFILMFFYQVKQEDFIYFRF